MTQNIPGFNTAQEIASYMAVMTDFTPQELHAACTTQMIRAVRAECDVKHAKKIAEDALVAIGIAEINMRNSEAQIAERDRTIDILQAELRALREFHRPSIQPELPPRSMLDNSCH